MPKSLRKWAKKLDFFNKRKGTIILQGDFNAHNKNKDDIITPDKFDQEVELGNRTAPHRNSEDSSKMDRREKLLDLCKALNMIITNGRKTGHPFGKITKYQWNGQAAIDYAISSFELLNKIIYFKVGGYSPFISDHCPLFFEVHSNVLMRGKQDNLRSP